MIEQQGKILIVDDESTLRRALCVTLSSMGFSVSAQPSGEAAIEVIRQHTFDAVLLDINMPGMGGYLMAHPGIPVMHSTLLRAVWGPEYGSEVEYLRTFMRQLRRKMGDDASEPLYLKTEPYIGYRFLDSVGTGE